MLHVLYLVHDVSDPAVRRTDHNAQGRRRQGHAGRLPSYRRPDRGDRGIAADRPRRDARRPLRPAPGGGRQGGGFDRPKPCRRCRRPDLIIARNLEMLALARRAKAVIRRRCRSSTNASTSIACCCATIGWAGDARRRTLSGAADVKLLVTSSPAFVEQLFQAVRTSPAPIVLLENKMLDLAPRGAPMPEPACRSSRPWRIGWFGALRCRKSLELLAAFSRAMDGRFEVVLRGRPAYPNFGFRRLRRGEPFMSLSRRLPQPGGPRRDLRRGPFLLGDRLLRRGP